MKDNQRLEAQPPQSNDLEGWRQAIAERQLSAFRLEALVAALQDLGPHADRAVRDPLARHLNDAVLKMLRRTIGTNHPNRGEDIIYRLHHDIFQSICRPDSPDGCALRENFGSRVSYRAKDAIAAEYQHSRIPLKPKRKGKKSGNAKPDDEDDVHDDAKAANVASLVERPEGSEEDFSGAIDDDAVSGGRRPNPALLRGARCADETIDVERVLSKVEPYLKRLAFRLHMDDVPFKSKRTFCIAQACGISEKTAREWVEEVRVLLQGLPEVQDLKQVGDKS